MIKEAAGIGPADDSAAARIRLTALVDRALPAINPDERVELAGQVALLTGLEAAGGPSAAKVDQRTLHGSVRRFLEGLARQKPVCLMFEDIHWADAALLDLIEFLASRTKDAPLLVLAQARPGLLEHRPQWGAGLRAFTSLSLEPLPEAQGRELISILCQERGLPETVVTQVGQGAGGNPLFAEELVLMIAERGSDAGVPSAIKALIAARMDALPPEQRGLLQFAAVFGKVFWATGVQALGVPGNLGLLLEALEQKDLIRVQAGSQFRAGQEYLFKHDLIRDAAYETLPRAERRVLHGKIADWLQQTAGDKREVYLDQLAHHSLHAGQEARAIGYLIEAAERARRMSAHVEEARLLLRASQIAERLGQTELRADLLGKRGTAFVQIGRWPEARADLETALAGLPEQQVERRAELLRDLAMACIWTMDAALAHRHAGEALVLATRTDRQVLVIEASALLATADHLEGNLRKAWEAFSQTFAASGTTLVAPHAYAPHTLYMLGKHEQGVQLSRALVQAFRGRDAHAVVQSLSHLGLNLAATGQYREAEEIFDQARRHGREYESWPMLARNTAISGGYRLDVFDYAGAERIAEEARELAGTANFPAASYSAGVDLLFNFIRRGELGRVEGLLPTVESGVENSLNWHRWLWRMRLAQVRAEWLLAQRQFDQALEHATAAVANCRTIGRPKYEVLGLITLAEALHGLGHTHEAIQQLRAALDGARPLGDPVLFLRAAVPLLRLDGEDALLREAREVADRIAAALPDDQLRNCFEASEILKWLRGRTRQPSQDFAHEYPLQPAVEPIERR
jgi:tetratricopeptide (TPR) repeat protein